MEVERREALVSAGRDAMRALLAKQPLVAEPSSGFSVGDKERVMANQAPAGLLRREGA
jgi:hypothetical protein